MTTLSSRINDQMPTHPKGREGAQIKTTLLCRINDVAPTLDKNILIKKHLLAKNTTRCLIDKHRMVNHTAFMHTLLAMHRNDMYLPILRLHAESIHRTHTHICQSVVARTIRHCRKNGAGPNLHHHPHTHKERKGKKNLPAAENEPLKGP